MGLRFLVIVLKPKISLYINLCHVMAIDCAKNAENVNCIFFKSNCKTAAVICQLEISLRIE